MMKINFVSLFAVLFGLVLHVEAQEVKSEARKHANEFLNIGVGARAAAMGNAQTAVADDVTAGYWNPAGLAAPNASLYPELALQHAAYFANIANYNYAAFTLPVDSAGLRRFGISLIRLGIDDIPNTLQLVNPDGSIDVDKIQSFSASDFAAIFSYAWQPRSLKNFSLGANAKVIYRGAGRFANAWGFGIDVAARYHYKRLGLGLVIKDLTNTYTAWTFNTETFEDEFINAGQEIPANRVELTRPSARFGISYDLKIARRINLLAALDADMFFDGQRVSSIIKGGSFSLDPHMGLELSYTDNSNRKVAFLRGGVYNLQYLELDEDDTISEIFPTAGMGFVIKNFQIDYALSNIGDFSTNLHSHIVSVRIFIKN